MVGLLSDLEAAAGPERAAAMPVQAVVPLRVSVFPVFTYGRFCLYKSCGKDLPR